MFIILLLIVVIKVREKPLHHSCYNSLKRMNTKNESSYTIIIKNIIWDNIIVVTVYNMYVGVCVNGSFVAHNKGLYSTHNRHNIRTDKPINLWSTMNFDRLIVTNNKWPWKHFSTKCFWWNVYFWVKSWIKNVINGI